MIMTVNISKHKNEATNLESYVLSSWIS